MIRMWSDMGPFAWPMLLIAALVLVAAGRAAASLMSTSVRRDALLEQRIHAVLFWGALAAAVGFLGQYSGIYLSLTAAAANDMVRGGVIAKGVAESIGASVLGLLIFNVAGILWYTLRSRYRRLVDGAPA